VFFGPLQARGMEIGLVTIAIGFLLLIRYKRNNHQLEQHKKNVETKELNSPDENNLNIEDQPNRVSLINFP
jgi:hypothetical protein